MRERVGGGGWLKKGKIKRISCGTWKFWPILLCPSQWLTLRLTDRRKVLVPLFKRITFCSHSLISFSMATFPRLCFPSLCSFSIFMSFGDALFNTQVSLAIHRAQQQVQYMRMDLWFDCIAHINTNSNASYALFLRLHPNERVSVKTVHFSRSIFLIGPMHMCRSHI